MNTTDPNAEMRRVVVEAYRRIGKAFERGAGVRLSAEEVAVIWQYDDAISTAVLSFDTEQEDS